MSSTRIWLADVWLRYRVPEDRIRSLKAYLINRIRSRPAYHEGWALSGVFLEVFEGEVLGIIGRNGAGKTTLLKVISRVLPPTRGWVRVKGRVAPLLGLGAGFHDDLTGRENVFLASAILGYSRKDVLRRLDRIVDFAELHDAIDRPLRTYSTGMRARLGFAVATDIQPEILILDEVLAVGDEGFQEKCKKRINAFRESGTTVLLVSHQMATVKSLCTKAVLIEGGKIVATGDPAQVVTAYHLLVANLQKTRGAT